jgi:diaminohydroxyphosphoribosylaminopyrimidine deaminase/5-amino-6-(5-phosphoribosylamino)uracil reductase
MDNPQLTTRLDGQPDPIRVIFDSDLRMSAQSNLGLTAQETPVWVFCKSNDGKGAQALMDMGVQLLPIPFNESLDIIITLDVLKSRGVSSLLLEGGGTLTASFLKANVIDTIEWFRAPLILGGDGRSGIGDLGLTDLNMVECFNRIDIIDLGDDIHERYERVVD